MHGCVCVYIYIYIYELVCFKNNQNNHRNWFLETQMLGLTDNILPQHWPNINNLSLKSNHPLILWKDHSSASVISGHSGLLQEHSITWIILKGTVCCKDTQLHELHVTSQQPYIKNIYKFQILFWLNSKIGFYLILSNIWKYYDLTCP